MLMSLLNLYTSAISRSISVIHRVSWGA